MPYWIELDSIPPWKGVGGPTRRPFFLIPVHRGSFSMYISSKVGSPFSLKCVGLVLLPFQVAEFGQAFSEILWRDSTYPLLIVMDVLLMLQNFIRLKTLQIHEASSCALDPAVIPPWIIERYVGRPSRYAVQSEYTVVLLVPRTSEVIDDGLGRMHGQWKLMALFVHARSGICQVLRLCVRLLFLAGTLLSLLHNLPVRVGD
jgi:hypothetical protein